MILATLPPEDHWPASARWPGGGPGDRAGLDRAVGGGSL